MMFDFIDGGTGQEQAQAANRAALDSICLQPRVLRNVEDVSLATSLLETQYHRPFGIAPMGMCNLIHPDADGALSNAAAKRCLPHCVSTAASTALEQSIEAADGNTWFQLYAGSDDTVTFELVDRALAAGYKHLVFTVDTPRHSRRTRDLENGFSVPLNIGPKQFLDFALHLGWSINMLKAGAPKPMNYETLSNGMRFNRSDSRGKSDFEFLKKLRDRWPHKLIVKGITSIDDAINIKQLDIDAIYVSNHGGRQLDSGLPAIAALPNIRSAVGEDYPLIFDSGIRTADDIARALAMGADFVMIGRPSLFALGGAGPDGLEQYFDRLEADLLSVMAQIGTTKPSDINRDVIGVWAEFEQ